MKPVYQEANVIVLASDQNYCPYLAVTIQSIIDNGKLHKNYDIVVLSSGIAEWQKDLFYAMQTDNVSIRFFEMSNFMRQTGEMFYTSGHISESSYYRIFIPQIFKDYRKAAYLDCDMIVLTDIAEIFDIDLGSNIAGVVHDIDNFCYTPHRKEYIQNKLHMDYKDYFNAGMMVIDIKQAQTNQLTEKCLELLRTLKNPMFHDQTLLNAVCYQKVKFLEPGWNYQLHFKFFHDQNNQEKDCPANYLEDHIQNYTTAKILHYTAKPKPWENPCLEYSQVWWSCARKTPFYEQALFKVMQPDYKLLADLNNTGKLRLKFWAYTLCSAFCLGNVKKTLKQKRRALRHRLKSIKNLKKN